MNTTTPDKLWSTAVTDRDGISKFFKSLSCMFQQEWGNRNTQLDTHTHVCVCIAIYVCVRVY